MWRKWKAVVLWVGLQISAATMKISTKVPKKIKIELLYNTAIPFLDIYTKKTK